MSDPSAVPPLAATLNTQFPKLRMPHRRQDGRACVDPCEDLRPDDTGTQLAPCAQIRAYVGAGPSRN